MEVFACRSLSPEPCMERRIGSIAGQGCYLSEAPLAALRANVQQGLELCQVSQGQTVVVRDIHGAGALLSGVGFTEPSEDGPRKLCVGPGIFLEGPVSPWKAWFESHL